MPTQKPWAWRPWHPGAVLADGERFAQRFDEKLVF